MSETICTEPGCESGCFDKRLSVRPCTWFRVDISGNPANIYHGCFIFNCHNEVRANTVVILKSIPPAPYVVRLQLRKEVRVWWSKGNAKGLDCRIVTAQASTTKFLSVERNHITFALVRSTLPKSNTAGSLFRRLHISQ